MATIPSTGFLTDVNNKIGAASAGDTITIPAGTFTWGTGGSTVNVNKAIFLVGAGEGSTIINLAADGPYFAAGAITITAAAFVSGFTINGIISSIGGPPSATPLSIGPATGFRVHHITYNGPLAAGYFAYCSEAFGLFDHITINSQNGSLQTFMVRGGANVWTNAHTMGTANAVYVEDTTFNGDCYVCEGDGSAQLAIRGCLITGLSQIDLHQIETSTDAFGVYHGGRQLENAFNRWTNTTTRYFPSGAMDIKAGTGMNFDNLADFTPYILVSPYGTQGTFWNGTFTTPVPSGGTKYITPAQIPTRDYIGVGPAPATQGKEPMYFFHNIMNAAGTDTGYSSYVNWPVSVNENNVNAGAIAQYGSTFLAADITQIDSSYFDTVASFSGASGVGIGTRATMDAINMSGKTKKVAFWVNNEGSWYQKWVGSKAATAITAGDRCTIATVGTTNFVALGAASNTVGVQFVSHGTGSGTGTVTPSQGRLYQWSGSSWVLYYEPYTYPHPLQGGSITPTPYRLGFRITQV